MKQKHSWEITDGLWEAADTEAGAGQRENVQEKAWRRRPTDGPTQGFASHLLRTGTLWKALPKEYGSSSSVHRYFRYRCEKGFFRDLWAAGLTTRCRASSGTG